MIKIGTINMDNVFRGQTQIAKVMRGVTLIWENFVINSKTYSRTWYSDKAGDPGNVGGGSSIIEMAKPSKITNLRTTSSSNSGKYYVDARVGNGSWVRLATGNRGINTSISNETLFTEIRFGCTDYTSNRWIDPAGLYYTCAGTLVVTYYTKGRE